MPYRLGDVAQKHPPQRPGNELSASVQRARRENAHQARIASKLTTIAA